MTDYKKGKIYVIKSKETEEVYIGSTCSTLKKRMCSHKSNYKRSLLGVKFRDSCSGKILKYDDAYIELIEECPCETKRELLDREGEIIKNTPNCVNTQIQGRTMVEWRKDNAEKIKQYSKDYYEKNKDMLKQKRADWYKSDKAKAYHEKRKEKINVKVKCPKCDKEVSKSNLTRHQKSKNCIIEYEEDEDDEEKIKWAKDNRERLKQKYHENKEEINRKRRERMSSAEMKQKKKEQDAKYRRENKDKIDVMKKRKVPCPNCGKEITASNLKRHIKTQHK